MDEMDRLASILLDKALNEQAGTEPTDPNDLVGLSRARESAPMAYDLIRFQISHSLGSIAREALEYTGE